jgi:hypothetical protein
VFVFCVACYALSTGSGRTHAARRPRRTHTRTRRALSVLRPRSPALPLGHTRDQHPDQYDARTTTAAAGRPSAWDFAAARDGARTSPVAANPRACCHTFRFVYYPISLSRLLRYDQLGV